MQFLFKVLQLPVITQKVKGPKKNRGGKNHLLIWQIELPDNLAIEGRIYVIDQLFI